MQVNCIHPILFSIARMFPLVLCYTSTTNESNLKKLDHLIFVTRLGRLISLT